MSGRDCCPLRRSPRSLRDLWPLACSSTAAVPASVVIYSLTCQNRVKPAEPKSGNRPAFQGPELFRASGPEALQDALGELPAQAVRQPPPSQSSIPALRPADIGSPPRSLAAGVYGNIPLRRTDYPHQFALGLLAAAGDASALRYMTFPGQVILFLSVCCLNQTANAAASRLRAGSARRSGARRRVYLRRCPRQTGFCRHPV